MQLVPTFTPSHSEKAMNTRGREASSERRQRRVNVSPSTHTAKSQACLTNNQLGVGVLLHHAISTEVQAEAEQEMYPDISTHWILALGLEQTPKFCLNCGLGFMVFEG